MLAMRGRKLDIKGKVKCEIEYKIELHFSSKWLFLPRMECKGVLHVTSIYLTYVFLN